MLVMPASEKRGFLVFYNKCNGYFGLSVFFLPPPVLGVVLSERTFCRITEDQFIYSLLCSSNDRIDVEWVEFRS